MKPQLARIAILAHALTGVTATITRPGGGEPIDVLADSDNELHLQPGDQITIKVASDDAWLKRQQEIDDQQAKAAAVRDDVDHTEKGQTLEEGLAQAAEDAPTDAGTGTGDVTATTGATTRRTSGKGTTA